VHHGRRSALAVHLLSFCGQAPALGAKPLVEGRRRFGIGSPRPHRTGRRGLPLGFARCCRLGRTKDQWFLWRKHNGLRPQFTRHLNKLKMLTFRSSIAAHPARPKLADKANETSATRAQAPNWYSPSVARVSSRGHWDGREGHTVRVAARLMPGWRPAPGRDSSGSTRKGRGRRRVSIVVC
jgi:hypothetical protein